MTDSLASFAGPLVNVLMRLLEGEKGRGSDEGPTCAQCGRTYGAFRRTGRLGCAACYSAFSEELRPLLRRIHGSTDHAGRVPYDLEGRQSRMKELKKIKAELERAVRAEEYERAAGLRDAIAELQDEIPGEQVPAGRSGRPAARAEK
ncbi:MAG: UvrB/UvrC motif-containing protein [Candidatus Eisenbacteria bacterium]|nr:UvrB/UvrC motif-containing protein [Candidatus Eisenbacteria bacterium]